MNFIDILFLLWVKYLVVLFLFTQLSVVAATAPTQEHQQQQQKQILFVLNINCSTSEPRFIVVVPDLGLDTQNLIIQAICLHW